MFDFTFLLLIAVCTLVGFLLVNKVTTNPVKGVPGPPHYPIIGNLVQLLQPQWRNRVHDMFLEWTKEYGTTWTAHIPGNPPTISVVHPREVEYILRTNFHNYEKGPHFRHVLKDLLGDGIFNVNGHLWKHQRQVASHLFKTRLMRNMMNVFNEHGGYVLDLLDELAKKTDDQEKNSNQLSSTATSSQASSSSSINIQDVFYRFTLDSIGEIAFGKNIDSLHTPVPFAKAFDDAQEQVNSRFFNPLWQITFWKEMRIKKAVEELNKFAFGLIRERREEGPEQLAKRNDLLSMYIQMVDEDGNPFSDKYLRDIIMNFLIAGRDTTAQTLSWLVYLLTSNPHAMEKVIQEVDDVLGKQAPDYDNVKNLHYMQACIDETLRLYPPVPGDPKTAVNDDVLPDGTKVPAGTVVNWLAYTMGRYEKFWDEPTKFLPERWFEDDMVTRKKIPAYQFIPFQAGPRICLGQRMAYLEIKAMMSLLFQNYIPALVPGQNVTYRFTITLPPNGVNIHVKRRESSANPQYVSV